jgi:hypothetical protein
VRVAALFYYLFLCPFRPLLAWIQTLEFNYF